MCDVVEGFVQKGKAEDFVSCVEGLMANNSITASEACEMMGRKLSEYEEAKKLLLINA